MTYDLVIKNGTVIDPSKKICEKKKIYEIISIEEIIQRAAQVDIPLQSKTNNK